MRPRTGPRTPNQVYPSGYLHTMCFWVDWTTRQTLRACRPRTMGPLSQPLSRFTTPVVVPLLRCPRLAMPARPPTRGRIPGRLPPLPATAPRWQSEAPGPHPSCSAPHSAAFHRRVLAFHRRSLVFHRRSLALRCSPFASTASCCWQRCSFCQTTSSEQVALLGRRRSAALESGPAVQVLHLTRTGCTHAPRCLNVSLLAPRPQHPALEPALLVLPAPRGAVVRLAQERVAAAARLAAQMENAHATRVRRLRVP